MSMTDPLADMLTRLRNGQSARLEVIHSPFSTLRKNVLDVLKREGFIKDFSEEPDDANPKLKRLRIALRYHEGQPVIKEIKRISKPGCRQYSSIKDLGRFFNGLGIAILSTPKGVMTDYEARRANVGGEVLCSVF